MGLRAAFRKHKNDKKAFKLGKEAFQLALEGNFRDAMALIDEGGDANYRADYYCTTNDTFPMGSQVRCNMGFIALEANNVQALAGLLQRGLDPNAFDSAKDPGRPILEIAISRGNKQAVDLLVKAGARTDTTLKDMKTIRGLAKEKGIFLPPTP